MTSIDSWPSLRYENWNDTIDSLHMKLQIIGKVKLALNPFFKSMGITVVINTLPCEFPDPVKFELDNEKKSYDKDAVHTWWKTLIQIQKVFESFRSGFRGKSSPVHFFWGTFDLCETRFSGNPYTIPAGADRILKYAENEENFTFGFWPV